MLYLKFRFFERAWRAYRTPAVAQTPARAPQEVCVPVREPLTLTRSSRAQKQ